VSQRIAFLRNTGHEWHPKPRMLPADVDPRWRRRWPTGAGSRTAPAVSLRQRRSRCDGVVSWSVTDELHTGAADRPRAKVLIRTFPPTSNANYGGILQAWALQRKLASLGFEPTVDSTRSDRPSTRTAVARVLARVVDFTADHAPVRAVPSRFGNTVFGRATARRMLEFAGKEIETVPVYGKNGVDLDLVRQFDAFIAGSDQVWRPRYVDVETYLFDFLPDSFVGPRVSYAASFGTDAPEFSESLVEATRPCAQKLTAVSVRETSGVDVCESIWGIKAVQMPDPTMLLTSHDYRVLSDQGDSVSATGRVAHYVLDMGPAQRESVKRVASVLERPAFDLTRRPPSRQVPWSLRLADITKPSVYEWLQYIATADFVVTDSFHGTVFSILFERPFLTLVNEQRGRARFESLLRTHGLEERLVDPRDDLEDHAGRTIDWSVARESIDAGRERATDFLRGALRMPADGSWV
jgi:hypothetical protein